MGLLVRLFGLGVFELPVVHDFADRGPLGGGHLDEIHSRFARHFEGLRGGYDAVLFGLGTDEAYGGDSDLFVHPGASRSALWGVAIERWDCRISRNR